MSGNRDGRRSGERGDCTRAGAPWRRRARLAALGCLAACALVFALGGAGVVTPPNPVPDGAGDPMGAPVTISSAESTAATSAGAPSPAPATLAEFREAVAALPTTIELDESVEVAPELAEHEDDALLLRVAEGIGAPDINALLAKLPFVTTKDVSDQDPSLGFVKVSLAPGTDVSRAAFTLEQTGAVTGAQPNYLYHLLDAGLASAALDTQTTGINDREASSQWALEKVGAYDAWDVARANGSVTVAIIDDGCMVDHEDLKDNIVATYNAVDGSADVSHVSSQYHGTHVAGIVSAVTDNGVGVSGVSYNAGILPIQVFEACDGGETASTEKIVTAYDYIFENAEAYNIKVVNISLGNYMTTGDEAVMATVKQAYQKGIVTVCAAGNRDLNDADTTPPYQCFPVDFCDEAIGVINLQKDDAANDGSGVSRAGSSNYNMAGQTTKNISAPGTSICSTWGPDTDCYTTQNGTSMASPLVAGIVALEFTADPSLSAAAAAKALYDGATDLGEAGWDEETGYGMASAYGALQQIPVSLVGAAAVKVGEQTTLAPSLYQASSFTWASSDPDVAEVSEEGVVTGLGTGTAEISATWGSVVAKQKVTVYEARLSCPSPIQAGTSVALTMESSIEGWEFSSSDTGVASIDDTGAYVVGEGAGEATITASHEALGVEESLDVRVYNPSITTSAGASSANVLVGEQAELVLEGGPEGAVWEWSSEDEATCTVAPMEDDSTKAAVTGVADGEDIIVWATATFEGTDFAAGIYVSVATEELSAETEIMLSQYSYTYDFATAPEPEVTVIHKGKRLVQKRHYTLEYSGNDKAGEATVTVVGAKGYKGTVTASFTIKPASLEAASVTDIAEQVYSGDELEPSPEVSMSSATASDANGEPATSRLTAGDDYELSYADNVNAGTATVTATGKGNYTGAKSATFAIRPASLAGANMAPIASQPYTGKAIEPAPALKMGGRALVRGTDYTLSYTGNVAAGTATVTASGKGNYTGTKATRFAISAPSVAYRTKFVSHSWKKYVKDGKTSGLAKTTKQRLKQLSAKLAKKPVSGSLKYRVLAQGNWLDWKSNGRIASAKGKKLEALQMKLTGAMSKRYNVYYRVYVQKKGWSGWAKNGKSAGTKGYGLQIQALQVKVLPKGTTAPRSAAKAFRKR